MDRYICRDGKKLRYGYTTGSCAAAASKGATQWLLTGQMPQSVTIDTPKGWQITIDIEAFFWDGHSATVYVVKDSGDDPDVTGGMKIFATVTVSEGSSIEIEGGLGVGRITKKGLRVPVGDAAINPVPLEMIRQEMKKVLPKGQGARSLIFAPEGLSVAKKTFNPKLGIIGGISILGTSGIVEPMSEEAFKASLNVELSVLRAQGRKKLFFVFGNFGRDYLGSEVEEDMVQKTSNFVAYMLQAAADLGFEKILYIGHAGKMVKIAAGMENTHSKYGDNRMTTLADCGKSVGLADDEQEKLVHGNTTDEAVEILDETGKRSLVFGEVVRRCKERCETMSGGSLQVECVIFTTVYGSIAETDGAKKLWEEIVG